MTKNFFGQFEKTKIMLFCEVSTNMNYWGAFVFMNFYVTFAAYLNSKYHVTLS